MFFWGLEFWDNMQACLYEVSTGGHLLSYLRPWNLSTGSVGSVNIWSTLCTELWMSEKGRILKDILSAEQILYATIIYEWMKLDSQLIQASPKHIPKGCPTGVTRRNPWHLFLKRDERGISKKENRGTTIVGTHVSPFTHRLCQGFLAPGTGFGWWVRSEKYVIWHERPHSCSSSAG